MEGEADDMSRRAALGIATGAVLIAASVLLKTATAAPSAASIEGVWAFVSETNTENGQLLHSDKDLAAIWIFSKKYYCLARTERSRVGRTKAELEAMTPQDQVRYYEQYLRYASTAGTYSVSGHELTRTWDISLGPEIIGQKQTARFSIDGDRLTVDLRGATRRAVRDRESSIDVSSRGTAIRRERSDPRVQGCAIAVTCCAGGDRCASCSACRTREFLPTPAVSSRSTTELRHARQDSTSRLSTRETRRGTNLASLHRSTRRLGP